MCVYMHKHVFVHTLWGLGVGLEEGHQSRGASSPRGSLARGGSRFRRFRDGFTQGLSFRHFFLALRRPLEPLWGGGRELASWAPDYTPSRGLIPLVSLPHSMGTQGFSSHPV